MFWKLYKKNLQNFKFIGSHNFKDESFLKIVSICFLILKSNPTWKNLEAEDTRNLPKFFVNGWVEPKGTNPAMTPKRKAISHIKNAGRAGAIA